MAPKGMGRATRPWRLLRVAAGVLGVLLLGEGAARALRTRVGGGDVPGLEGHVVVPDPDLGWRTADPPLPRAPGIARILVVGGSATAGLRGPPGTGLASLLAEALGPSGAVVDLHSPGHTSEQRLRRLRSWPHEEADPIVVFAVSPAEDPELDRWGPTIFHPQDGGLRRVPWAPWPGSPYNGLRSEATRPLFAHHLPGDGPLRRHSALWRSGQGMLSALVAPDDGPWPWGMAPFDPVPWGGVAWTFLDPLPPPIEAGWRVTADVLRAAGREVDGRGRRFLVLGVPPRVTVEPGAWERAEEEGWDHGEPGGFRRMNPGLPEALLVRVAGDAGLDLVVPALDEAGRVESLYDQELPYWNAAGQREAAWSVLLALERRGWVLGDPRAWRERLLAKVPVGSQGSPGDEPQASGGKGGGKGQDSEVTPRFLAPERLSLVLRESTRAWDCEAPRVSDEARPEPREEVVVRVASTRCRAEGGGSYAVRLLDGANQAEWGEILRAEGAPWHTAAPPGLPREAARFAIQLDPPGREGLGLESIAALEAETSASNGVGPLLVVGGPVPPERAERLVQPDVLLPCLPSAPAGWQALDAVPLYRPHDPHAGDRPVPADAERQIRDDPRTDVRPGVPWTAQVKRWYRGPRGSFEAVVQDSGRQVVLLRSREGRLRPFLTGGLKGRVHEGGPDTPTLALWQGAGLVGFRTCKEAQGLCKVVAPLVDPADPAAPVARWNLILMGPATATDQDFAALASGVRRDLLPPEPRTEGKSPPPP